ncbi:MAG: tRNA pseudouridine(55) synthase TruB [Deltaproteobacteria bacterium]|nr:tRNA pseudouridine(55) synthase TruB [Deltaproteobacteria bacterium]
MNGILLIDKEQGPTSFDVVYTVARKLNVKKVGHAGTLDPLATGLLIIGVGKATKILTFLSLGYKKYDVCMVLGVSTDTYDIEGKILHHKKINISEEKIKEVLNSFVGEIEQAPPPFSAVKYKGKKLYEYARRGEKVFTSPKKIKIYNIFFHFMKENKVYFSVRCSKGTYIRSLVNDIGEKLKTGATVESLRRTESYPFTIKDAVKFSHLDKKVSLISIDKALSFLPSLLLRKGYKDKIKHGQRISPDFFVQKLGGNEWQDSFRKVWRVVDENSHIYALIYYNGKEFLYHKVLY